MSATTPITHDPELPFAVLRANKVWARFSDQETAVDMAVAVDAVVVDTTPREFPTVPGIYESSSYPLDSFMPYQLADGVWYELTRRQKVSEADLIGAGVLTRLVPAK